MNASSLVRRIAARFSLERRELDRLCRLPRGAATTSTLIRPSFDLLDGGSFAAQYRQIFVQDAFAFRPRSPRPRIIDCGANVGVFTVFCRRRYPDCTVTAFEPDPNVFEVLRRNVARCCGLSGVELVRAAVTAGTDRTVTFFADHCDAGRTGTRLPGGTETRVDAVRLRDYLDAPCDLLKLDIEGAEVDVLGDCADRLANVPQIFVEYHSFAGHPQRLDAVVGVLERVGFRLFVQAGTLARQPFLAVDEFLGMDMQLDIWGTRP